MILLTLTDEFISLEHEGPNSSLKQLDIIRTLKTVISIILGL